MTSSVAIMASPVGPIRLTADENAITEVSFVEQGAAETPPEHDTPLLAQARHQLSGYFAGDLREFDLPVSVRGTAFQRLVWAELEKIPYGVTFSYGQIAAALGLPMGASRAVGTANGRNPIAIVVPCHRVIGANGRLVGYAAGLERKKYLLNHESERTSQAALFA